MRFKSIVKVAAILVICSVLGCSGGRSFKDASELESFLNGQWNIVSSVYNGTEVPNAQAKGGRLDFENSKVQLIGSPIAEPLDCTFDVTKSPYRITMGSPSDPPYLQGIIEIKGDSLRTCYRMHAKSDLGYPESFESTKDSGLMLIEAQRASK